MWKREWQHFRIDEANEEGNKYTHKRAECDCDVFYTIACVCVCGAWGRAEVESCRFWHRELIRLRGLGGRGCTIMLLVAIAALNLWCLAAKRPEPPPLPPTTSQRVHTHTHTQSAIIMNDVIRMCERECERGNIHTRTTPRCVDNRTIYDITCEAEILFFFFSSFSSSPQWATQSGRICVHERV